MTESQKAFEAELLKLLPNGAATTDAYQLLKPTEYMMTQQYFSFGITHGRKQALEEAIAVARVEEYGGTNVQAAAVRIGKAIKELIK